jgi:mono/diheme cytochrome c family protein
VPAGETGTPAAGAAVLARCNACHRERRSALIDGHEKTQAQWERFFESGGHDRHAPLGGVLSRRQLADAKSFLMPQALDASTLEQGAGSR